MTPLSSQGHEPCRVYFGSHGCDHPRGHDGPHECCLSPEGGADGYYEGLPCFGEDATVESVLRVGTWSDAAAERAGWNE